MVFYLQNTILNPYFWFLFILGLFVGSFLNVCIFRIPENNFFQPLRSHCRNCGALIPFYLNIPIISFLILRGKSKCCNTPISYQYPIIELVTAILFALIFIKIPFITINNNSVSLYFPQMIRYLYMVIFICILLICSVIDLKHMIIPDVLTIPMIILSPLIAIIHPELTIKSSLIGLILGGGVLYLIAWIYWIFRKEIGIGFGDVKFLAAIGGWIGYEGIVPTLFIASIVGASVGLSFVIYKRNIDFKTPIPFGPFLALGAVVFLCFGNILYKIFEL